MAVTVKDEDIGDAIGWTEALGASADNPKIPRASGESLYLIRCKQCDQYEDPEAKDESEHFPEEVCPDCGTPRTVERYRCSSLETAIKGQFEQWVRDGAQQAIQEAMQAGDLDEADRMRSAYMASRHEYKWDGKKVIDMRFSWLGVQYMAFLLLRRCHPKMTEEHAIKIVRANPRGWAMVYGWAQGNSRAPGARGANRKISSNGKASDREPETMDGR